MILENFHFLRPTWLAALLLLIPLLGWAWRRQHHSAEWERICEPHLLKHLLTVPAGRSPHWPLVLFTLGWISTCIALAGPTWQRLPQTAFVQPSRTVLVLGLAPSMNQHDIAPSRLARARHKLLDAVDQMNGGSVALVVYREEAFPATPLTDDRQVLRELIPLLETNLTPGRTVLPARGIEVAAEILKPVGLSGAQILLVTDGADDDPAATRAAASLVAREGAHVSVLGVAGEDASLASLAAAGRGTFSPLSADGHDLEQLLVAGDVSVGTPLKKSEIQTDEWRDMGVWLTWIPLLLAPLAFRKGWAAVALLVLLIQLPAGSAQAEIRDWFERADQRASRAFAAEQYGAAAEKFKDPAWQAAARYRAGDFAGATEILTNQEDPESQYNRGNALAKTGHLDEAIEAYEQALVANPENEDARFNRDLLKKLLDQQQKQNPRPSGQPSDEDKNKGKNSNDGGSGSRSGNPQPSNDTNSTEGSDQDSTTNKNEPGDQTRQGSPDSETGQSEASVDANPSSARSPSAGTEPGFDPEARKNHEATGTPDARQDSQQVDGSHPTETSPPNGTAAPLSPGSPSEQDMARWMARLPDDPGGLLREKIRRDYIRKREMRQRGGRL